MVCPLRVARFERFELTQVISCCGLLDQLMIKFVIALLGDERTQRCMVALTLGL